MESPVAEAALIDLNSVILQNREGYGMNDLVFKGTLCPKSLLFLLHAIYII